MDALKQTISKYKMVIIGALVLVGLMFAYNVFYLQPQKESQGDFIRSENQSITSSELGREIISTLNRLKGISIDPEFFEEDRFVSLIDFSVEIQEQPVGKNNPFKEINVLPTLEDEEVEGAEVLGDITEETAADESGSALSTPVNP